MQPPEDLGERIFPTHPDGNLSFGSRVKPLLSRADKAVMSPGGYPAPVSPRMSPDITLKKGRPRPRRGVRQARRPGLGAGERAAIGSVNWISPNMASGSGRPRPPHIIAGRIGLDNKGYRGHQVWPESGCFPRILIVFWVR